ncbi:MAG TPA: winged helix-turn-helix domain-containing protein [Verrucomicrobiae bacterium]|nr:winged helix-turn-helix domain-containing protein [Verrucomicrobiae bacterium]
MSTPAPETLEREKDKLWVLDSELIRRMGAPEKIAREAIRMLETKGGFPKKQKLWGDRRYWPDVKAYLDRYYGSNLDLPQRRQRS